jgi:hypothetical protein
MTSGRSTLVDLALEFRHGTEMAIKVSDGKAVAWLPRAAIEIEGEEVPGGMVTVTMPEALAVEKGLA